MKFKIDENIGRRGLELLRAAGHDVMTVLDQGLGGATDERLFATCAGEGRALIPLDHDFGQVTRFPPERSAGVIVLEVGPRASVPAILGRLRDLLAVWIRALWPVPCGSSSPAECEFILVIEMNESKQQRVKILPFTVDESALKRLSDRQRNQLFGCMHAHNELRF